MDRKTDGWTDGKTGHLYRILLKQVRQKRIKHKRFATRAAGIEGQVATMLQSYTRQIDTIETTAYNEPEKKHTEQLRGDKT